MASRISNPSLHASIARTEILRALQDVADMEARANKRLADNDQPTLPKSFYTADEWEAREQEHADALAALRPTSSKWEGWRERLRREAPSSRAPPPDDSVFVDMTCGALADRRIRGRRLRQALSLLAMIYRPSGAYGGRIEITPARAAAVAQWRDAMASMPIDRDGAANAATHTANAATNADLARAAALARERRGHPARSRRDREVYQPKLQRGSGAKNMTDYRRDMLRNLLGTRAQPAAYKDTTDQNNDGDALRLMKRGVKVANGEDEGDDDTRDPFADLGSIGVAARRIFANHRAASVEQPMAVDANSAAIAKFIIGAHRLARPGDAA
jgi:hypothetical protein